MKELKILVFLAIIWAIDGPRRNDTSYGFGFGEKIDGTLMTRIGRLPAGRQGFTLIIDGFAFLMAIKSA